MNPSKSLQYVVPVAEARGDDAEDTLLLQSMKVQAVAYLESFEWFPGLVEMFFGAGIGGILAIFLIRTHPRAFSPKGTPIDEWLWVVVGDVPSAYLVLDTCPKPSDACLEYLLLLEAWAITQEINEVSEGQVFPFVAGPVTEVRKKMELVKQYILPSLIEIEDRHFNKANE